MPEMSRDVLPRREGGKREELRGRGIERVGGKRMEGGTREEEEALERKSGTGHKIYIQKLTVITALSIASGDKLLPKTK